MRIFYLEDVETNVALVERVARMGQHEVVHYASAPKALEHLDQDCPDLILVDIYLEGPMTGLDFVRHLRAAGRTLPIVVVTAYVTGTVREDSFAAGGDAFLPKPLQVRDLWHMIQHYDTNPSPHLKG